MDRPATLRDCPECSAIMETARIVPGFGVLPELKILLCPTCGEVVTIAAYARPGCTFASALRRVPLASGHERHHDLHQLKEAGSYNS